MRLNKGNKIEQSVFSISPTAVCFWSARTKSSISKLLLCCALRYELFTKSFTHEGKKDDQALKGKEPWFHHIFMQACLINKYDNCEKEK